MDRPPRRVPIFLPTPSTRRATGRKRWGNKAPDISTHALHEEGDALPFGVDSQPLHISTHALHEEGDRHRPSPRLVKVISTHALHEEGDRCP